MSPRPRAPSSSSADLKVTVQDQTGAALVIAVVTFVDSAGASHTLAVDARGVAAFAALPEGPGELRVTADAFQSYRGPIVLKKGANAVSLQLPLANITAEIVVRQDEADRQGNSFVSTLDERQIAELPDDPDELEQMLQQMAGPGAVMRINGFRGGQMPPKNQIRQIRFRMNSYAAENHDAGGFGIDIFTKPGTDAWRGMSSFGFRDESLNARNAFAPRLGPEQYRRVGINFNGPLVKNKTSLAVSTDGNFSYESKTINAQTPDQSISAQVRRPSDISNVVVRVEHALTAKQSLMVEVQHHDDERRNLGVGDYDLPSRAYHRDGDGDGGPRLVERARRTEGRQRAQGAVLGQHDNDRIAVGGAGGDRPPRVLDRRCRSTKRSNDARVRSGRQRRLFVQQEARGAGGPATRELLVRFARPAELERHLHLRQQQRVRARRSPTRTSSGKAERRSTSRSISWASTRRTTGRFQRSCR